MAGWSIVLLIGGIIYIAPALLYWIFGSAEVQPWNDLSNANDTTAIDTESASDPRTEETTWSADQFDQDNSLFGKKKKPVFLDVLCMYRALLNSNEMPDSIKSG